MLTQTEIRCCCTSLCPLAPQHSLGFHPLMSEKWSKSIKENQPFSANPLSLGWDDFLSCPFIAANEHCSKERREKVARARKVSILCLLMTEEMRNVILAF